MLRLQAPLRGSGVGQVVEMVGRSGEAPETSPTRKRRYFLKQDPQASVGHFVAAYARGNRGQTIACGAPRRDEERYQHGSSGWGWKARGCLPRRDSAPREEQGEQEEPYGKGQVKKKKQAAAEKGTCFA